VEIENNAVWRRMIMTDTTKVADDIYMVPWEQGNGQIRREVWVDKEGKVTHYHLAYINRETLSGDNGWVMGYDYENGCLHSHLMEELSTSEFSSLEEMEETFDIKWNNLPKESGPVISHDAMGINENEDDAIDDYQETKGMRLTITKGSAADFFRRGRELASKLDRGEQVEKEKVVIFGNRHDLCYSGMQKQ
jgi:hypothetical protein